MTRLADAIVNAVHDAGVVINRIDREVAKLWDRSNGANDLRSYTGWYWHQVLKGKVVSSDKEGPFPCWSAAVANAYKTLQLRPTRR